MIHIRPILPADRNELFRLFKTGKTFHTAEINLAMEIIDQVLEQPDKEDYTILCLCLGVDKVLAGYICFGPIPLTDACYDMYWILVDNKFSRRGLGSELVQAMEERLVALKGRRIYIDTSSTPQYEPARSFYEKNGFWVAAVLEDFYRPGDDKIIYVKQV